MRFLMSEVPLYLVSDAVGDARGERAARPREDAVHDAVRQRVVAQLHLPIQMCT